MSERDLALAIIAAVNARGMGKRAAYVAVTTAMAEGAGLNNWRNDGTSTLTDAYAHRQLNAAERAVARESMAYGDGPVGRNLDSMGLYQQRPMSGWGSPAELMDPILAAGKFLDGAGGNKGLRSIPNWEQMDVYAAGQKVQGSLPKDAWLYQSYQARGIALVDSLWTDEVSTEDDMFESQDQAVLNAAQKQIGASAPKLDLIAEQNGIIGTKLEQVIALLKQIAAK